MKIIKALAVATTLLGVAALAVALAPSVYGRFDSPVIAQAQRFDSPRLAQARPFDSPRLAQARPFDSLRLAQARPGQRALTVLGGRGAELGIHITDVESGGVRIEDVQPDSAAEKAGLKHGDVIVEFDGERVRSSRQFARLVEETPAGRTVNTTIVRNGQKQDVKVTPAEGSGMAMLHLRELERLRDLPFDFDADLQTISRGRLGIAVTTMSDQLAEYFGAKSGVLITAVADGSVAASAGLKTGDVITSVNGQSVSSAAELMQALRDAGDQEMTIGIIRDKKESTVKAKIEPRRNLRGARPV